MLSKLQETIEIYGFNPNQGIQQQSQRFHELLVSTPSFSPNLFDWLTQVHGSVVIVAGFPG